MMQDSRRDSDRKSTVDRGLWTVDQSATQLIADAVREAERGTSGEIVPFVIEQSDDYEESIWLGALVGAGLALLTITVIDIAVDPWGLLRLYEFALIVAGASAIGGLIAALSPRVRVMLAGSAAVEERTRQAAQAAFIAEEVFSTRDRTGILIFLSMLEHRVIVLGDTGINSRVTQSEWDGVVRTIITGMHAGRPVDALVDAIRQCGEILCNAGCTIADDDIDELPNTLRMPSPESNPSGPLQ